MKTLVTTALIAFAFGHAGAQSAKRTIPLPDTLGAAFSAADSATRTGTPTDFDFLVGVWEFEFQNRRPDGGFNDSWHGHWFVEKKHAANPFVEDHFRWDDPSVPYDVGTWTYRVFNPSRKLWEMQGVSSSAGAWSPGLCWSDAQNRYLLQRYGPMLMRIRYLSITDTSFLWRADRSTDNGKTWMNDWWTMRARRIAGGTSDDIDARTRDELVEAREAIWRAWFANDAPALARLLPAAAAAGEPSGWQSRDAIVAASREFAASGAKLVAVHFSNTRIYVNGDAAVLLADYTAESERAGNRMMSSGRATEVFVRTADGWVNPFWYLSKGQSR